MALFSGIAVLPFVIVVLTLCSIGPVVVNGRDSIQERPRRRVIEVRPLRGGHGCFRLLDIGDGEDLTVLDKGDAVAVYEGGSRLPGKRAERRFAPLARRLASAQDVFDLP